MLNLQIENKKIKTRFIVAKDLSQDIIKGVDILKPNNFIIDYSNNSLRCGDSKRQISL